MLVWKHGGGQVSKTLQCLVQSLDNEKVSVGAIVAEDERRASRHLRLCASERKIPMMVSLCYYHCRIKLTVMIREYIYIWSCFLIFPSILILCSSFQFEYLMQSASWIVNSLHLGKLLPLTEDKHCSPLTMLKVQELPTSMEFSAEIWNLLPLILLPGLCMSIQLFTTSCCLSFEFVMQIEGTFELVCFIWYKCR